MSIYRCLTRHHPDLDGLTRPEALPPGESAQALKVAESIAQGSFA
jgi:hypothetical protein